VRVRDCQDHGEAEQGGQQQRGGAALSGRKGRQGRLGMATPDSCRPRHRCGHERGCAASG
jgi:hypothetical protein